MSAPETLTAAIDETRPENWFIVNDVDTVTVVQRADADHYVVIRPEDLLGVGTFEMTLLTQNYGAHAVPVEQTKDTLPGVPAKLERLYRLSHEQTAPPAEESDR